MRRTEKTSDPDQARRSLIEALESHELDATIDAATLAQARHRASIKIVEEASPLVEALVEGVRDYVASDVGREEQAEARQTLATHAASCKKTFQLAINAWPHNPRAKAGLHAVNTELVRLAIADRDARAGRALLGELDTPDPAFGDALDALDDELAAERRAKLALEAISRDQDVGVAGRSRAFIYAGAMLLVIVVSWVILGLSLWADLRIAAAELVWVMLGFCVLAGGLFVAFRKKLFSNSINRAFSLTAIMSLLAMLSNRFFGWVMGRDALETLVLDLLIEFFLAGFAGFVVHRALGMLAIPVGIGAVLGLVFPESASLIYGVAHTVVSVMGINMLFRAQQERKPTDAQEPP